MRCLFENKIVVAFLLIVLTACAPTYVVHGPQGGLATRWTWPKGFNQQTDTCRMVILMHGIFSSKDLPPMPALAKSLAEQGIASVAIDFGGHGRSEGTKQHQGPVCIIHGTKDGIVPLWCSQRYDSIYHHSTLHLIEGENHLMINHLNETKAIISDFLTQIN